MPLNILAIILGAQTGWAALNDGLIVSGVKAFKPDHFRCSRLRHLRLKSWLDERGLVQAVYVHEEDDNPMRPVLKGWCEQRRVALQSVPMAKVSKYWTGSDEPSRSAMIERAQRSGFAPGSGNEAAALALLAFATMANR